MLKKEAFKKVIQVDVDDSTLDLALLEAGIDGTLEAIQGDLKSLELAAIPLLQSLMIIASESEGGYSVSYSLEGIKIRLLFLAKKHGLTGLIATLGGQPKITTKRLW